MRICFWLLILFLAGSTDPALAVEPQQLMPREQDYASMWWAKGFPTHSSDFPWHRCVQTGRYGYVFDTKVMQFPHFGGLRSGDLLQLPPATLGLRIVKDDEAYDCVAGGQWTRKTGPRLIESGRFFQRGDVTDLVFESESGEKLNVDARMESAAWADRLGLTLSVRPGKLPIQAGDASFGRVGGGYGLDGTNDFQIPHKAELDTEQFTLCFWAFVPEDYQASEKTSPWLVCKNRNEAHQGNFGILIKGGKPEARINIGGGSENAFTARSLEQLRTDQWSHLAMTYDGSDLCLYVNGTRAAKQSVNRHRIPGKYPITFGRREDNDADGYQFRGVIDEINYFDRALDEKELRLAFKSPSTFSRKGKPVSQWGFKTDGLASIDLPREQWKSCQLSIALRTKQHTIKNDVTLPVVSTAPNQTGALDESWSDVSLVVDPVTGSDLAPNTGLVVTASETVSGRVRPVTYEHAVGWHRINLDGIKPIVPDALGQAVASEVDSRSKKKTNDASNDVSNDAMERVKLTLSNKSEQEQVARLMFEKTRTGFAQRIGSPITGVSAILRDTEGNPTGIPVQLSKNWHADGSDAPYARPWFHGISQVRLPPRSIVELELTIVYGHWGGVGAASTSQLCLIGWGSNQLWNQAAIGSWGESICFEPDQVQANCSITDVRPLMLKTKPEGKSWSWTANVGGGDFFRMFRRDGERVPHTAMKTTFHRYGPCLTEVTNRGRLTDGIEHEETISLARTDDLLRVTYHLKMQVKEATDFSRLAIFQVGADTYNFTRERRMAVGTASGLTKQWKTIWGGNRYRTQPLKCVGDAPWASLHDATPRENPRKQESWANRGIVIRSWKARLGGKPAPAWMAEHGVDHRNNASSTLDLVPPPGVNQLLAGDFVDATIEHLILPRDADDYYGPNESLRAALADHANSWQMISREATGNQHQTTIQVGELQHRHPDICIKTDNDKAKFSVTGGIGYVPITLTGLTSSSGYKLVVNGNPLDQSVHGNDFWQTDYDVHQKRWSQTYNVLMDENETMNILFQNSEEPRP